MNIKNCKLPNLELLEYQAKLAIKSNNILKAKRRIHYEKEGYEFYGDIEMSCEVFPQVWETTATAFDLVEEGPEKLQTHAYTVVFYEEVCNAYVVFVNNKLCYIVDNPSEYFKEDLKKHELRGIGEAREFY